VLDFSSALYLGFRHAGPTQPSWRQLTTGVPAALREPPTTLELAGRLATLLGSEAAVLSPSTLHLFLDLLPTLAKDSSTIYVDDGTYPIARWGAERAAAHGVPLRSFAHHDPDALRRQLRTCRGRPVVLADGLSPVSGPAPVREYLEVARSHGGLLVLDDTQACGILGAHPSAQAPLGHGGGGSAAWHGVAGPDLVVGASLAKGLGVPIATLAASRAVVEQFKRCSHTRVHCSPPSAAVVHAAWGALALAAKHGERLRAVLVSLVNRLRSGLARHGLAVSGGSFPVQTLASTVDAPAVHRRLLAFGVLGVLHRGRAGRPLLSLLVRADHSADDIAEAVEIVASAAGGLPAPTLKFR
jgi:8-amino-7-oxononanoate synthase